MICMNNLVYTQMFENKIYTCTGYDFQNLFFEIMKSTFHDKFIMPKPQGRYGDRKNDGYIPEKGEYFAVYGPDTYDLNINYTIQKIETDLTGLINNIQKGFWKGKLKKFIFVVNTRHNKIFPVEIVQKVEELQKKYSVDISLWGIYELQMLFDNLSIEKKQRILQCYIKLEDITLNILVLNKIIDKISNSNYLKSKIDGFMEFETKIEFNRISKDRAADLLGASFSINNLDEALNDLDNTGLIQEQLSSLLKKIYIDAKEKLENQDQIFDYIINKLMETSSQELKNVDLKIVRETVMIIVSKYFENCTIFEKNGVKE